MSSNHQEPRDAMTTLATARQAAPQTAPSAIPRRVVLAATGIEKRFGATDALRGVDVRIDQGEVVAIMGPSGSGKSTLLHCLAGILRPDAGTVTFDGQRIDDLGETARSRLRCTTFGFVFQFGQLVPELTALENVALPLMLASVARRDAEARAAVWFPRLGLEGLEHRRPGDMSGGQAQRVAVARALVKIDEGHRGKLRSLGLLTRDARAVERKKPGRPKARKKFQFSKR